MFEQYMKDIKDEPKKELVDLKLFNNPAFNPIVLKQRLDNIDKLSDQELYQLLKDGYDNLLSNIFIGDNPQYLDMFINTRFLTIMIQVMSSTKDMTHLNRTYCNKIAYDYLTLDNNDPYIKQLMISLSKTVNKDILPRLLGLGLSEELSAYLALARFSSQKEVVNVKRVNFVIMTSNTKIMTEQMIVYIYEKLFDSFTQLYVGTMIDNCKTAMSQEMEEIYSTISLSVLDILNLMPSMDIRKVLISYVGDYQALYSSNGYRFSMQCLSNDYYRINQVLAGLTTENIYVP